MALEQCPVHCEGIMIVDPLEAEEIFALDAREEALGIGDVNSNARGSGARYNAGKPPVDLLPLEAAARIMGATEGPAEGAREALRYLGKFQATGGGRMYLQEVIRQLYGEDFTAAMEDAARVFDYGRKKYAAWNWAKGQAWSVPLASATRHLFAIYDGEETDPESGLPHKGHVVCNILFLAQFMTSYPEGNDLPGEVLSGKP